MHRPMTIMHMSPHLSPKKRCIMRESVSTPCITAAGSEPVFKLVSVAPTSILGLDNSIWTSFFCSIILGGSVDGGTGIGAPASFSEGCIPPGIGRRLGLLAVSGLSRSAWLGPSSANPSRSTRPSLSLGGSAPLIPALLPACCCCSCCPRSQFSKCEFDGLKKSNQGSGRRGGVQESDSQVGHTRVRVLAIIVDLATLSAGRV